jgi:sugar transferase (PEP-CTERM/EpsH1 system associated)
MRIFFVCQRVPFPPDRGDKITTFHELRHLAREHEVHVFCLADGEQDLRNVPGALDHARSVTAIPVSQARAKPRALNAVLTGRPLSVAMLDEKALHAAIQRQHGRLKPDLIFVYSSNVAQYAEPFAETARIMQFADLDSLKFQSYAVSARLPMKWVYAMEGRRLLEYERHIAATFTHSLVCTPIELGDFKRLIPDRPVSTVGNGVDVEYFHSMRTTKLPAEIVFTGVMDYIPNVDAVTWFCDEILPLVRQRLAHARFTICGSRPSEAVRRLAERPGVTVTGRVEDIRPYLDRAEVFVAPLRIARGIQNKVLEALAMGLPVVASRATWMGTGVPEGSGILAADEASAFASHVIRLLEDGALRAAMSQRAREVAESELTWERQMGELRRVIGIAAARSS